MPRPLPHKMPPYERFLAKRGEEIAAKLLAIRREKGRLPTGLSDEDVLHHALAELKRNYGRMKGEDAAVAWTLKVGRNYLIDEYRKEQVRRKDTWQERPVPPPSPEQVVFQRMRHGRLAEALRDLPERQRQAVELVYFDRLQRKQAAAILSVSETAVKGLLQRAIASLRDAMKHAPAFVPIGRLRRLATAATVASPRLLAAVFTLSVLTAPADPLRAPHVQAYVDTSPTDAHDHLLPDVTTTAPAPADSVATARARPRGPLTSAGQSYVTEAEPPVRTRKRKKVGAGVKIGDDRVGHFAGDDFCAHATEQDPMPLCANQNLIGVCPLAQRLGLVIDPYTTCERHSDPVVDPPPP